MATNITIVHFNDVYNIQPRDVEPVGGAARFATAIRNLSPLNPLVLFSGDALNPSIMSTITKGKQMVPLLNEIHVACAVCGNHDFDHGVDNLVTLCKQMTFPWLLSNVYDILTGEPLADAQVTCMLDWQGKKIGLMGLVEVDWLATLSTVDPDDVEFLDYVEEGKKLCKELRSQGADYIIALTHMRWPNDTRLAENVEDIDLILGGHDHDFIVRLINGKYVIKSGTDFRNFALVTLSFPDDPKDKVKVSVEEREVTKDIEEDETIKRIVDEYTEIVGGKMESVMGHIYSDLDGRFSSIRHHETNLGNFMTDIMLAANNCDIALLNSGSLRSDAIHLAGEFKVKDLMAILPMPTTLCVLQVTGRQLLEVLENSVSKYPALEGRFAQLAGVFFTFDPKKPAGERIVRDSVKMEEGAPLDPDKAYKLCTTSYIAEGHDGYDVFKDCPVLVSEEDGPQLSTIVKNHFTSVSIASGQRAPTKYQHWQNIISNAKRQSLMSEITSDQTSMNVKMSAAVKLLASGPSHSSPAKEPLKTSNNWQKAKSSIIEKKRTMLRIIEQMQARTALSPCVEGRIVAVSED